MCYLVIAVSTLFVEPHVQSVPAQDGRPKPKSAVTPPRHVSTPFERKRKQEVVQLNKKVETNFAQQVEETNHLKAFKKSVTEQEFEVAIQCLEYVWLYYKTLVIQCLEYVWLYYNTVVIQCLEYVCLYYNTVVIQCLEFVCLYYKTLVIQCLEFVCLYYTILWSYNG